MILPCRMLTMDEIYRTTFHLIEWKKIKKDLNKEKVLVMWSFWRLAHERLWNFLGVISFNRTGGFDVIKLFFMVRIPSFNIKSFTRKLSKSFIQKSVKQEINAIIEKQAPLTANLCQRDLNMWISWMFTTSSFLRTSRGSLHATSPFSRSNIFL